LLTYSQTILLSANDPEMFVKAARLAEPHCDAIDLNLGCPQRIAHAGHFGSYEIQTTSQIVSHHHV
jgi:tRNA-dihydrouridine synthase 1